MSDINKIFKDAINGYEAPFDASAWDKLSNQLNNPMEDAFRNSLEGHEAPYNPNAWSAIKGKIGSTPSLFQWIAGSTAAAVLVATAIMLFPSDDEETTSNPIVASTDNSIPKNGAELLIPVDNNSENNNDLIADNSNENSDNSDNDINNDYSNQSNDNLTNSVENNGHNPIKDGAGQIPPTNDDTGLKTIATTDPFLVIDPDEDNSEITTEVYSAEFSSSDLEICQGETVLFESEISKSNIDYEWNFGDGNLSTAINPAHEFNTAGIYNVMLTVRNKESHNILASTSQTIVVNKIPEMKIDQIQDDKFIPSFEFTNMSNATKNITWRIDNRLFADKNSFEYTFRGKGTYTVQLSGENEFGCSNSTTEEIVIDKDFNLGAPTAFAPEGTTDYTFMPSALKIMNNEFKMIIYSPGGNPIYETNNANEPWTGIDMNTNSPAPSGTMYTWIVYLTNTNGTTDRYFGQVLKL